MKSILIAAALFLTASTCQATILEFRFQFTGFELLRLDGAWAPEETVNGYFSGEDRNADSVIDRSELLAFRLNDQSYFGCTEPQICGVGYFSYKPLEVVKFTAWRGFYIPGTAYSSTNFQSLYSTQPFRVDHQEDSEYPILGATLQTGYAITPSVPEPESIAMLAAGLAIIRRRLFRDPGMRRRSA